MRTYYKHKRTYRTSLIMTNSVNQPPDKGTGWGAKAAEKLEKVFKKYPARDKTTRMKKVSKKK